MKRCIIVAAGDMNREKIDYRSGDLLIAADAGYSHTALRGLKTDFVVGDFDSLGAIPEDETIIKYPVMKDDTDTMLAVKIGFDNGCTEFFLYGALGGRLDHMLANIQTLSYIAERGASGYIIANDCCVTVIKNKVIHFKQSAEGVISVFSANTEAKGVCLDGLLYPLTNYNMVNSVPIGVSNEFIGKPSSVAVKDGSLVVIFRLYEYIDEVMNIE